MAVIILQCHYSTVFDCCRDPLPLLLADFLGYSSKTLTLFTALCSSIVNKEFLCFSFRVPFPRQPFVSESPGLLLEVFIGARLACLLSCLKASCRWKIYDCMPWKPHIPFEVLLLLWCCPHWWRLHLLSSFDQCFYSQWECKSGKEGRDGVHRYILIHRYLLIKDRFLLLVCNNKTLISCFWKSPPHSFSVSLWTVVLCLYHTRKMSLVILYIYDLRHPYL